MPKVIFDDGKYRIIRVEYEKSAVGGVGYRFFKVDGDWRFFGDVYSDIDIGTVKLPHDLTCSILQSLSVFPSIKPESKHGQES